MLRGHPTVIVVGTRILLNVQRFQHHRHSFPISPSDMSETAVAAEPMDVTTNEDRTQLRELLQREAADLRKATVGDRVFKDECMRCFNTPYFPGKYLHLGQGDGPPLHSLQLL